MKKTAFFLCVFLWTPMEAMDSFFPERQTLVQAKVEELTKKSNLKYRFRIWGLDRGKSTLAFIILHPQKIASAENFPVITEDLLMQIGLSYNPEVEQPACQQWSILKTIIHRYKNGTWEQTGSFRKINIWDKNNLAMAMPTCMKAAINYLKKNNELPEQAKTTINWEIKHFSNDWEMLGLQVAS